VRMYHLSDDGLITELHNVDVWSKWYDEFVKSGKHVIRHNNIRKYNCDINVSTVFLGLNHNFNNTHEEPILFETMIFGGELNEEQWRWTTKEKAKAGHHLVVQMVLNHKHSINYDKPQKENGRLKRMMDM